jgi:hypothetical protein
MFLSPSITRRIWKKEKEMKSERAVSLEEPAPATRNFGLLVVSSHSICKVLG